MFHIYKNKKNKFEAAFVSKGRLVFHTSPQAYERKSSAVNAIQSLLRFTESGSSFFQDDSVKPSVVYLVFERGKPEFMKNKKPAKLYIPKSKK